VRLPRSVFLAVLPLLAGCYVEAQPMPPPSDPNEVVVDNPPPPPPPQPEPAPPPAPPGGVWVNGYHRWDGHAYVWEGGHYEQPPRHGARYVPGHWEERKHGKVWVNGHWA
jgi:WXXGXW repeat (2 copies)